MTVTSADTNAGATLGISTSTGTSTTGIDVAAAFYKGVPTERKNLFTRAPPESGDAFWHLAVETPGYNGAPRAWWDKLNKILTDELDLRALKLATCAYVLIEDGVPVVLLTIHVDGRASNRELIDAGTLRRLKPDAVLLNTSRGFVVRQDDLASWLAGRPEAQAILDVHAEEPFAADDPLIALPNAHLAPHLASRTRTAMSNMSWVVRDLWRVLEGEPPHHPAPDPS